MRRRIERSEHQIPKRKQTGEVLIERFLIGSVVPAMECGSRDCVFENAKAPINVRMQQQRIDGEDGQRGCEYTRIKAKQE